MGNAWKKLPMEWSQKEVSMRTNIVIDDDLLQEAFLVSNAKTKKELIHEALRLYVKVKKRKDLTELAGSISFHEGYNYKKLRRTRVDRS